MHTMAERQRGTLLRTLAEHAVKRLIDRYTHPEHGHTNLRHDAQVARGAGRLARRKATEAGAAAAETTRQLATQTSERARRGWNIARVLPGVIRRRYFGGGRKA